MKPLTTEAIIAGILEREGGFADRRADRGGPTKYGITQATLSRWRNQPATVADVRELRPEEAAAIYRVRYVKPFELLPETLAALLIDWGVTSGPDDPIKALQRILQAKGLNVGPIDGILGPQTRRAVLADPNARDTYRALLRSRIAFYLDLALNESTTRVYLEETPGAQLHNLRGWIARACEFLI
jgi:lysozyme family protein